MKKIISGTVVVISLICVILVYINMSMDSSTVDYVGSSYAATFLNGLSTRLVSTTFNANGSEDANVSGSVGGAGTITSSGDGTSKFSDFDVYSYDEDLYKVFKEGPVHDWILANAGKDVNDNAAKTLSAVLTYCVQKPELGFNFGVGVIANALIESEGKPGYIQDTYYEYIDTEAEVNDIIARGEAQSSSKGFGLLQWTWWEKLVTYGSILPLYLNNGVLTDDDMRAADLHHTFQCAFPAALQEGVSTSSPYQAGYDFSAKYERPRDPSNHPKRGTIAQGLAPQLQRFNNGGN